MVLAIPTTDKRKLAFADGIPNSRALSYTITIAQKIE
jgi:hypothetical protein